LPIIYILYYKSKSQCFVSYTNSQHSTYRHQMFYCIPHSLMQVLVPLLFGKMSNILKFSDFYRNMLFLSEHTIWCENETCLLPTCFYSNSMCIVYLSLIRLFRKENIVTQNKFSVSMVKFEF